MTEEHAQQMIQILTKIEAMHRENQERQARLVWIAIPIFALLCVQTVVLIAR